MSPAPDGFPILWGIAWRARSAAWMLDHRELIAAAITLLIRHFRARASVCSRERWSRSGGSEAADGPQASGKQCLVAEGLADVRVDAEPSKELWESAGVDEHVVVRLVITTPEFAVTDEHRHLTPEDPITDDRATRREHPVLSEPDPGRLPAPGRSPLQVADVEREWPGVLERTRHGGQRTIDFFLAVEVAQRMTDTDDRIGGRQRILGKTKDLDRHHGNEVTGKVDHGRRRIGHEYPMACLDEVLREQPGSATELQDEPGPLQDGLEGSSRIPGATASAWNPNPS